MKIKLNTNLGEFKKGLVLNIKVDKDNIPIDKYWRARLKDSQKDNCIEVLQENIKTKSNKKRVD